VATPELERVLDSQTDKLTETYAPQMKDFLNNSPLTHVSPTPLIDVCVDRCVVPLTKDVVREFTHKVEKDCQKSFIACVQDAKKDGVFSSIYKRIKFWR